jgi:glyoxylase-like metal-dependent hydrolase (beta-lactamase superfamily II)
MTYLAVSAMVVGSCRHPQRMTIRDGSLRPTDFPAMPMLLVHPVEGPILFDTGYDQAFLDATDPLPERFYRWLTPVSFDPRESLVAQLADRGIAPEDVRHVVLSHFHGDHMAGIGHFPRATIHCARIGHDIACRAGRVSGTRQGILPRLLPPDLDARVSFFEDRAAATLPSDLLPFTQGADLLGDGSILAIELPGHCPGHWGIAVRDERHGWHFLVADAAWSLDGIARNMPPPRLATAFLGNTAEARATLAQLHALHQRNPEVRLTPYHCPVRADEARRESEV